MHSCDIVACMRMYVGVSHMNVYFVREAGAGGLRLLAWAPGRKADKVLSGLRCSNFLLQMCGP